MGVSFLIFLSTPPVCVLYLLAYRFRPCWFSEMVYLVIFCNTVFG